jgi:hypothetical protein
MTHMAVSPSNATTAASFVAMVSSQRRQDAKASQASAAPARDASQMTPGLLVGRADLSQEAVLKAIAERMTFEGRDASKAPAVLNAAMAGRPVACAFLRRLVLPPPQSSLQMPIQSILRERGAASETRGSWFSRLSFGR